MRLLFVGGVMNAAWITAITLYVLVERPLPGSERISKPTGLGIIGACVWLTLRQLG